MGDHSKNKDGVRKDGKHAGGNGNTMKKGGDWNGRNDKGGTPTEELPKQGGGKKK